MFDTNQMRIAFSFYFFLNVSARLLCFRIASLNFTACGEPGCLKTESPNVSEDEQGTAVFFWKPQTSNTPDFAVEQILQFNIV